MALLVLADGLDSHRQHLDTEPLTREVDGLGRLLESSLSMADELLVTAEAKPPLEPIDVNDLIAGACDVIQAIVGPAVRVETALQQGDCRVYARQVDLDRILLNIVNNAATAMPSGGVLVIETSRLPAAADHATCYPQTPFGRLRLTIGDTGRGMTGRGDRQLSDSIRLSRPDAHGAGLESVSMVLLRLGGELEIAGCEGAGTIVSITLPLAPPACERIH
jgi:two-component system cell cycle sensor histidine kinase/response regulator CckA